MVKHFFIIFLLSFTLGAFSSDGDCMNEKCTQEVSDFIAGRAFEVADDGRVNIRFSQINDSAYGIYELMTGDKIGDDFGDTHGVLIEVSRTDQKGVNYKLVYFTNIYSLRSSQRYSTDRWGSTYDQYFTEENIIKIALNNKAQGREKYFEFGIGVVELNRDDVRNWLSASGQQLGLHDAIGSFHPNNILRGGESERGAFIEAGAGKKIEYKVDNKSVRIIGDVKISGIANTITDSSSVSISAGADYYYQAAKNTWAYKAGAKVISTIHQTDSEPMNNLVLSVGAAKGNYSIELLVRKIFAGHKQNYQDYNHDREAIFTLQFSGKFGAPRRN